MQGRSQDLLLGGDGLYIYTVVIIYKYTVYKMIKIKNIIIISGLKSLYKK